MGYSRITNTFQVTEEHLKLLRRFNVMWCGDEYGSPMIDPKRPYGNSDVEGDVYEIIEGKRWDRESDEPIPDKYQKLHGETEIALQVCLSIGEFKTGIFEEIMYGKWRPKAESPAP